MKITINHPDGRIETREGTVGELTAFERGGAPQPIKFVPYEVTPMPPVRVIPDPWPPVGPQITWCGTSEGTLRFGE